MPIDLVEIAENPIPPGARVDQITTSDGIRLRCGQWPANAEAPRGTVVILHGRTEFIEKYFETVTDLRRRGFAVATFDWRGQGRSQREISGRCHVESFADYDRDLDAFMRQIMLPDCPRPHFALAHSMGALAALRASRDGRARFDRLALLSPMLALSPQTAPPAGLTRAAIALLLLLGRDARAVGNRALRDRYTEPVEEPRQEVVAAVLKAAPELATGLPTARWLYSAIQAMREIETPRFARSVKQPTLLIAAGRDRVVSNEAVEQFAGDLRFGAQIIVPGARHEILMEPDPVREQFWAAFDAFIPGGDPYDFASSA